MIAEIALNLPLRRTFDYLVPAGEEARVLPGWRVIVPFGPRLTSGVVVLLKQESAVAADRLRAVHQPAEGGALFSAELLRFTRWIGEEELKQKLQALIEVPVAVGGVILDDRFCAGFPEGVEVELFAFR